MESLVDVEYKYIRVNIVFPFHKLQDAERTSHCPPPSSYVTYLVRLAETLMTSFRVGVARDVRPLELLWLARARRVNGFCTQSQYSYSTFVGGVCEVLWKFWFSDGCLSKPRWLVGSVGEWRGWYYLMQLKVFHFHYMWACIRLPGVNETTKLMGMGISYSVHRNCKGNLASDKNKRLLLLSLFILPLVRRIWVQLLQIEYNRIK